MLNDFNMTVLAVLATQGGIAVFLVVVATLEPEKAERIGPAKVAGSAQTSQHARRPTPALSRHR